jgi:hypothetical protein
MAELCISDFDDLLAAARRQPDPQRLLFVFSGAEMPDDATPAQRRCFADGTGGALVPLMCVDKAPDEIATFAELVLESRASGPDWAIVFVAALGGQGKRPPTSADAEAPLRRMVEAIRSGSHGAYIPFDRAGRPVVFD